MKILVVVDMQNDFVSGALPFIEPTGNRGDGTVANCVAKVKEAYSDENTVILWTKDTHTENYLNTQEGKNLPVSHCIKNTVGWEIIPELKSFVEDDKVFEKSTFGSVCLAQAVHNLVLKCDNPADLEVELIGVCTDICVVSNALLIKAFCPEVLVSVDSKCCAGVTQTSHEAALITMQSCQVVIK